MLFLKGLLTLHLLCHKSATTFQIDSYNASSVNLKPDLYSPVRTGMTESIAPPQQPNKRDRFF